MTRAVIIPEPRAVLARRLSERYGADWQGIMSIAARTNVYCRTAVSLSVSTDEEASFIYDKATAWVEQYIDTRSRGVYR